MTLRLLYATWHDGALRVETLGEDGGSGAVACSADERYDVRLTPRTDGAWLRAPIAPRRPFAAAAPGRVDLEPCDPVPGEDRLRWVDACADASGGLAVLGDGRVHVRHPTGGAWRSIELPADFRVTAAAHGHDGSVWIAGSAPARRLRTSAREAALLRCPGGSSRTETVELGLRPLDAWRAIRHSGLEKLSGIEASGEQVTAISASADLHDDPWEFVLTQDGGGLWRAKGLRARTIRAVLRLAVARAVVTSEGDVFAFDAQGRARHRIRPAALAAAIDAGGHLDAGGRLIVRGADGIGSHLALAVGTYAPRSEGLEWLTHAILVHDGHRLEVAHRRSAQQGEGELLDVAIAR